MREKSLKIQKWLIIILTVLAAVLLITTWQGWFLVSPLIYFNLALLSLGLYGIHMYQKEGNKNKEVYLLSITAIYINLAISTFIHNIWSTEKIFTQQGITKLSIFVFLAMSVYLAIAYIRARITYKQVKGNQRHNETWHVTKKEIEEMEKSPDIYINLGKYHETTND
ncbi:hypothetical protein [Gracilibacillus dipsosauri]|uniref:hypothetical protein n=1 Tax=Gracilibacillus dipsosauri TaxID=178340 RepID=UPI00240A00F1